MKKEKLLICLHFFGYSGFTQYGDRLVKMPNFASGTWIIMLSPNQLCHQHQEVVHARAKIRITTHGYVNCEGRGSVDDTQRLWSEMIADM